MMNQTKIMNAKNIASLLFFFLISIQSVFAQVEKDSLPKSDDFFEQWINYSRPGQYHQLLGELAGNWSFKGRHFSGNANPDSNKVEIEFKGTLARKSFASGRYFIVEFHDDKIQMPLQGSKLKDTVSIEIETEGYDNIKKKFVKTRIGNHLGSDISYSEGDYDPITKTIIYNRIETLIPGVSMKTFEHLKIIDKDHYVIEIRRERENTIIKDTEMYFTRTKRK